MRTESDLRAAFRATAEQTTICAGMVTKAKETAIRRRKRRNFAAVTAAIIAIAMLIPITIALFDGRKDPDHDRNPEPLVSATSPSPSGSAHRGIGFPQTTAGRSDLMTVQIANNSDEYRVGDVFIYRNRDSIPIRKGTDASSRMAVLTVYSTGSYDPTQIKQGEQIITADNGRGFFNTITIQTRPPTDKPTLAWEYYPGSWATLETTLYISGGTASIAQTRDWLLSFTADLRFSTPAPLLIPFKMSYLPPGTWISSIQNRTDADGPVSTVTICDRATGQSNMSITLSSARRNTITPNTTIAGHSAQTTGPGGLWVNLGDSLLFFSAKTDTDVSLFSSAEIRKIAEGISGYEVWSTPSSWYDNRTATPNN